MLRFTDVMLKSNMFLLILSVTIIILEQIEIVTQDTPSIEENNQPPVNASITDLLISTPSGIEN